MVNFMKKWQRIYLASTIVLLFVGPLFGLFTQLTFTNPTVITPLTQTGIHSSYNAFSNSSLAALSNTIKSENIFIQPASGNIASVTVSNFTLEDSSTYGIYVQKNAPYLVEFTIIDSELNTNADGFNLQGSPIITGTNVFVSGPLLSNNYPTTTIDSPVLKLNNFNASLIQLKVTSGTFIWNHSKTSSVVLNGFTTAILDSDNITTGLTIEGSTIVTIFNSQINGTIHESVKPILSPPKSSYLVPFAFVFQPQAQVAIALGGSDNIRGPDYPLSYNLSIEKNGIPQPKITGVLTDTYVLTIDTASTYTIHVTCQDMQGNIATDTATITILPQADLLWFILMIVIIAAAVVGSIVILFMRKQRQWQKTALVEIPA
jgi:hypothetical protein